MSLLFRYPALSRIVLTIYFKLNSIVDSIRKYLFPTMSKTNLFAIENGKTIKLTTTDQAYAIEVVDESCDATVTTLPDYFQRKIVIIDSVNSGSGRTEKNIYKSILKPLLDKFQIDAEYVSTDSPTAIANFAEKLPTDDYLIIFISGDTSINELVNNLEMRDGDGSIVVFPIPAGTGNALALSLGIVDVPTAITKLFTGNISNLHLYQIDLPKGSAYLVNQEKIPIVKPVNFLVVFSWAFHASLVADSDTPELRKFGLDRFKMAASDNLAREQSYPGQYLVNNKTISGPFSYWVLTPAKKFEPTFEILPNGDILDNNLHIVSFNTDTDIMEVMMQIYQQGQHIHNPKVVYEKVDGKLVLNATTNEPIERRFCIDGAIIALPGEIEQSIEIKLVGNSYNNWTIQVLH